MLEKVVLVDENDVPIGQMEKLEAHQKGLLHRAFSIFIFNRKGELLLQKRALQKYHSGGKWTNTCCSHPRPGEDVLDAASRRLQEEMGITCALQYQFNFVYKANLDHQLIEHELDHVFFGYCDELPLLNPAEANSYKYRSLENIQDDILKKPEDYTPWFKICLPAVIRHYQKQL